MPITAWIVLSITAFVTAILSAIIGFGGGIVLLGTMLLFLAPAAANALHAAVQLVSNTTRLVVYSRHIDWPTVAVYGVGAAAGVALCGLVILRVYRPENRPILMTCIGLFVLAATYLPRKKQQQVSESAGSAVAHAEPMTPPAAKAAPHRRWWWPVVGAVTGFLGPIVGATGPVTAPLFLRVGLIKESLISTKAACQAWVHLSKLILFAFVGRELGLLDGAPLVAVAVLGAGVLAGTLVGKRLLASVSPRTFVLLFRIVVTSIALKILIYDGFLPLGGLR